MDVNASDWGHNGDAEFQSISAFPSKLAVLFLGLLAPLAIIIIVQGRWKLPPPWPTDVPSLGDKDGFASWIWKCYRRWPLLSRNLQEGYDKFNRYDQPFLLPSFSLRPQVILPAKDLDWLIRLPDTVASSPEIQNENIGLAHVSPLTRPLPGEKIVMTAIHTHLNRHTSRIQADMYDELRVSIDREFGTDCSQWREVPIFKAMDSVAQRVGARVTFGLPMCRDEQWLASAKRMVSCFGAAIISAQLMPWFIQPIVSPFMRLVCDTVRMRCFNSIRPIFETWYDRILQEQRDGGACDQSVPYNFATSVMRTSLKASDEKRASVSMMFTTLLVTALLPFNGIALAFTAALLDIASSAPEEEVLKTLREEAIQHVQSDEDWNNLASFSNMPYTESAVKESLRLSPSQARVLNKEVMQESGLTLPSGQHLPKGTWLGAASMGTHLDDRFYLDAKTYKPFRFVKQGSELSRCDVAATGGDEGGAGSARLEAQDRFDSRVPFLSFGAGRHRCSGQAFVLHLNKLLVSYITTHYEIESLDARPANWEIGDSIIPPQSATIRVRRVAGK
ncbi:cytochrome P450 [Aspergillus melleus]|uniref:cytochrome P450 n=1 Tax=Aspergillus melleus TaxID=138277 RepID=UPI001E8DC97B|nr:uncharacterized protein LDX57_004307 [Aspergillus melleus]KAH8426570.1 hypothetical protein LDX57_004307 [Aspergillus melleus]